MYSRNVFKKYQVNMGNPYQVVPKKEVIADIKPEADEKKKSDEIIEKAKLEAEKILQKARQEADEMLKKASDEIAAYMLEIEQQAKEEGYRRGEKLARNHYQSLIDEADNLKRKAEEDYQNTILGLESEIVDTVLEITKKVIGMELSNNRDTIVSLIRNSLLGSMLSGEITVRVSPDDYEYVQKNRERLLDGIGNAELTIKKDSTLNKGGCIVETEYGTVDSSVETQLKAVEDIFKELLGKEPVEV